MDEPASLENRRRNEQKTLAFLLVGLGVLLVVHVLWSRRDGGMIELQRLPKHEFEFKIELNEATVVELMQLPGVGKTLAVRILEDRERRGCFASIDDLQRVKGVGPKLAARLRPYVTVTFTEKCGAAAEKAEEKESLDDHP